MNEFEISIKSAPHGSVVTVQGSKPTIVIEFGILANSISERCGIPRELLAAAVMTGAEIESLISSGSVCVDQGAIDRARRRKVNPQFTVYHKFHAKSRERT